jgi:transaldolase
MNQLEQLRSMTRLVADTGDIDAIKIFRPEEATTNPTLILASAQKPEYRHLIEQAIHDTKYVTTPSASARLSLILDHIFVNFGLEILKLIPGRISTEVDAHLAFDYEKTIGRALSLVHLYEKHGVPRERLLIKVATTWEGIRACEVLEMEGVHCNMTLIFSLIQAAAAAEVKATLTSPFVGRILDWYKKSQGVSGFSPSEDPGVKSVRAIYAYLKKFASKTQVMGASFRNVDQIRELAGCDALTIAPALLTELRTSSAPLPRKLSPETAEKEPIERLHCDEPTFRFLVNEDPMCTEKLAEGVRVFAKDWRATATFVTNEFKNLL